MHYSLEKKFQDAWSETEAIELDVTSEISGKQSVDDDSDCVFKPLLIRATGVDNTYVLQYTSTNGSSIIDVGSIIEWLCTYLKLDAPRFGAKHEDDVEILETSVFNRSPNEVHNCIIVVST